MHILDIFQEHPTTFSFEFFPPKTDAASEELFANIAQLQVLAALVRLRDLRRGGLDPRADPRPDRPDPARDQPDGRLAPDLRLPQPGRAVRDPRPLRRLGDREHPGPPGRPARNLANYDRSNDAFQYADDLVRFVKAKADHPDPRGFGVGVAGFPEGHPDTPNRLKEMDNLKRKVDAGADYICTQLFFDNRDFYDFRERCDLAGIRVPILAGIMPVAIQIRDDEDGRAGPRRPASRATLRRPSTAAPTTGRSPGSASTGPPSSAATSSTTTSAASTSTP